MKPISFDQSNVTFAKDQPEYMPLPGHIEESDQFGKLTTCWGLTWKERVQVLFTGKVWQQVLTFRKPLQPQLLLSRNPLTNE